MHYLISHRGQGYTNFKVKIKVKLEIDLRPDYLLFVVLPSDTQT